MDYRDRQLNDFLDNGVRDNVIPCDDEESEEVEVKAKPFTPMVSIGGFDLLTEEGWVKL